MKLSSGTILLVADGAKMLLLMNKGSAASPDLCVITHREIDNPPSRDQRSDAPGLSYSSMGPNRSTYQEADVHQQREDRFAAETAGVLAKLIAGEDGDIIVAAPPATLRILRQHYDRATQNRLVAEIDKDLTGHTISCIEELIAAWTPSP